MMRIITGTARGTKLVTLEGDNTRPTAERVKEAVFSMLQFELEGRAVLDLFAGSGQMGLEALSRGAAEAICVDASPSCAALIRRNGEKLGLAEGLQVMNADYRAALSAMIAQGKQVDLAFLDPPYASGFAADAVEILFRENLLKRGGAVIVEHAHDQPPELRDGPWEVSRVKRYGACGVTTLIWRERE